ncbi:helix-turn-helix domain-containing protein [Knoellia sp. CPCC 206453]|uniref:helix-turn-helix domain-containing protein n=1 Tax=Knoellia pratensis TaxID=3404796 RepID=UPI00361B0CAB
MDDHTMMGRALAILEAVASDGPCVPLADLTRSVGLPKSTVLRVARDLARRGLLDDALGSYSLGGKLDHLTELAHLAEERHRVFESLEELRQLIGGIVWFAPLGELGQPAVLAADPYDLRLAQAEGWPSHELMLTRSPAGLLTLAHRPTAYQGVLESYARRGADPAERVHLARAVEQTRQVGVAVESGQVRAGWRCVAAANLDGPSPHVVGVVLRQNRIPTTAVVRPIRELAASLTV